MAAPAIPSQTVVGLRGQRKPGNRAAPVVIGQVGIGAAQKLSVSESLLQADDGATDTERNWSQCFVVGERYKASAEIEAAEARMSEAHENADYDRDVFSRPIPFFDAEGKMERLTKKEAASLKEHFGASVAEYAVLYGGSYEQAN
jgi:hypothetical protein